MPLMGENVFESKPPLLFRQGDIETGVMHVELPLRRRLNYGDGLELVGMVEKFLMKSSRQFVDGFITLS